MSPQAIFAQLFPSNSEKNIFAVPIFKRMAVSVDTNRSTMTLSGLPLSLSRYISVRYSTWEDETILAVGS
jgi:hypothetical protein